MLGGHLVLPGVSCVLAVASGKGGVGKTTIAVNLSLALHQAGMRVGLYDADLYGPNVPLMLGVRRKRTVDGFVPIYRASTDPYIEPLVRFGIRVMSIGFVMGDDDVILPSPRDAGDIVRQTLQDVIWGDLDVLLVDLPPGTGEPQRTLLDTIHVDGVLVVTTPQDLSLMDASRSLGLFRRAGLPILGVVENMSYLNCPHCGKPVQVFHHSDRAWRVQDADLPLLGRIPMDPAISRGIDAGHPLMQAVPDSPQALAFRGVASRIIEALGLPQDEGGLSTPADEGADR